MKTAVEMEKKLHVFSTSALYGREWSASRIDRFNPEERTTTA
jgi:hypothetical protein